MEVEAGLNSKGEEPTLLVVSSKLHVHIYCNSFLEFLEFRFPPELSKFTTNYGIITILVGGHIKLAN